MENSSQCTDEKLVKLFCAGHTSAGEELIRRYEPLVDRLCSPAFVRTFSEDLKQSLWVRFWKEFMFMMNKRAFGFPDI